MGGLLGGQNAGRRQCGLVQICAGEWGRGWGSQRKRDGSIQKDECQGHTSKAMLRFLTGVTE